jgi:hypothetical protein
MVPYAWVRPSPLRRGEIKVCEENGRDDLPVYEVCPECTGERYESRCRLDTHSIRSWPSTCSRILKRTIHARRDTAVDGQYAANGRRRTRPVEILIVEGQPRRSYAHQDGATRCRNCARGSRWSGTANERWHGCADKAGMWGESPRTSFSWTSTLPRVNGYPGARANARRS